MRNLTLCLAAAAMLAAVSASAAGIADVDAVPHLDRSGRDGYRQFLAYPPPRAYAVAPGGAWGYAVDAASPARAEREALANCQAHTRQRCQIYARDDSVVLDPTAWTRSWGPYLGRAAAAQASIGAHPGERFPDLLLKDANGHPIRISDLRGKVVVVHFWGSWCPPCQREMPDLARLAQTLKGTRDIRFVFVQVREDYATARAWARKLGHALPLYDSGIDRDASTFALAGGGRLADRDLALAFPTSYVLDKRGIVAFAHVGPIPDWSQYLPFIRDAAARSGR